MIQLKLNKYLGEIKVSNQKTYFTTPTGRLVSGSVSQGNDKDYQGKPLTDSNGQPIVKYYIGVAIPKTAGVDWKQEAWGQQIMAVAQTNPAYATSVDPATGMPFQGKAFAFKVTDGDSTIPNQNGKKPCDQEGYPGHWVLNFSNGFAPKACNQDGTAYLPDPEAIKRGYFVQVYASIGINNDNRNPGVFLNHEIVSLQFHGEEIHGGADASAAGFGGGAMPAGATAIPAGAIPAAPVGQNAAPAPQAAAPAPANDLVQQPAAEPSYNVNGTVFTKAQLIASGWNEAQIAALPPA